MRSVAFDWQRIRDSLTFSLSGLLICLRLKLSNATTKRMQVSMVQSPRPYGGYPMARPLVRKTNGSPGGKEPCLPISTV